MQVFFIFSYLVNLKYNYKAFKKFRFKERAPIDKKLDGEFSQPFLSAEKITIEQQIWPREMKEKFSRRSKKGAPECKNIGKKLTSKSRILQRFSRVERCCLLFCIKAN